MELVRSAGDLGVAFLGGDEGAWFCWFSCAGVGFDDLRLGEDFELAWAVFGVLKGGARSGPGVVGADEALDLGGGKGPVDEAVGASEFGRVGDVVFVLGFAWGVASPVVLEVMEGFEHCLRGELGEAVVEFSACFVLPDGDGVADDDVSGVEGADDVHGGDACFRVAFTDGGLDAGGATPAGEEGGVQVDAGDCGEFDEGAFENLSVGHDDKDVGLEGGEWFPCFGLSEVFGLEDGEAGFLGEGFYLGRGEFLFAANRAVGLGDEADDFEVVRIC